MKASEARLLKVGDKVGATFGNYRKKDCDILAVNWPVFTLRWKDHKGQWQERTRTYRSMFPVKPQTAALNRESLPAWLSFDQTK